MTEHNSRIVEALNRYITTEHAPHYAIMLNGEWGSGKTFFIKEKWLKNIDNLEKYSIVYVSLFGLKTIDELKDLISHDKVLLEEFISKSQPGKKALLKSKEIKNTNATSGILNIGKQLFEKHIGININDIIKIFTRDWLSEDDKDGITKVLILDDLERVQMNINEVFGFISNHLESTSLRVIIIGNENEIPVDNDYSATKEKVIGDTYRVDLDIFDALNSFIEDIHYSDYYNTLINDVFKSIMTQLNFSNLRIVRQSLIKLKPLLEIIETNSAYKNYEYSTIMIMKAEGPKSNYLKEVITFFILVNFQKSLGILDKKDISNIRVAYNSGMTVKQYLQQKADEKAEQEKNKDTKFHIDFSELLLSDRLFTPLIDSIEFNFWWKYIWDGELDKKLLERAVEKDMLSIVPDKRLQVDTLLKFHMGYWDYSVDEFNSLQKKLIEELQGGFYTDTNAIIAAYALFLHLSDTNINLLRDIKNVDIFFDNILSEISLTSPKDEPDDRIWDWDVRFMSYKGYGIFDKDDNIQVKEFVKKIRSLYDISQDILLKNKLEVLITNVADDQNGYNNFFSKLLFKGSDLSRYYSKVPVLEWIGSERLWNILMLSSLSEQRSFFYSLSDRYSLNVTGCEDSCLIYKSELLVLNNLYVQYKQQYEFARELRDNKIIMYKHLYDDATRIYNGLKQKLEIGESIAAMKLQT